MIFLIEWESELYGQKYVDSPPNWDRYLPEHTETIEKFGGVAE